VGTTPIRDVDRDANVEEKDDSGDTAVELPPHPCAEKIFDTSIDDAEAFAPAPPEADRSADTLEKATRTTMDTPLSSALAGVTVDWRTRALPPPEFAASVDEKYSTLPVAGHSADDSDTVEREVPAAAARPRRRSAASVDDVNSDGPHHGKVIDSDAAGGGVVGVALGRKKLPATETTAEDDAEAGEGAPPPASPPPPPAPVSPLSAGSPAAAPDARGDREARDVELELGVLVDEEQAVFEAAAVAVDVKLYADDALGTLVDVELSEATPVRVTVANAESLGDAEALLKGVGEAERDAAADRETVPTPDTVAVPVADTVAESVCTVELPTVLVAVAVPVAVGELYGEMDDVVLAVGVSVPRGDDEALPDADGLPVGLIVADAECVLEEQPLADGESVTNADCDTDPESVTDPDAVALIRGLEELVADGASVRVPEADEELVMKAVFDRDAVTVIVTRADPVPTADRVLVAETVRVLFVVAVLATLPEEVSEGRKLVDDALDVGVLDVENVAHEVPENVGDVEDDADCEGTFDADDEGVSDAVPRSEMLGVADCVELAVGETVPEAVSGPIVAGPGVTVGV
jgi:hypothetical protein